MRGPGLVVTLNDAQRDAEGRFPGDASADDLVVHQQDIEAVLNALWSAGAEAHPDAGSAHHRHLGAAVRRQHAAAQRPHLQPAVRGHRDRRRLRDAGGAGGRSRWSTLYKRYVVRFGLGYTEEPRPRSTSSATRRRRSRHALRQAGGPARVLSHGAARRCEADSVTWADAGSRRRQLRQLRVQPGPVPRTAGRARRRVAQRRRATGDRRRRRRGRRGLRRHPAEPRTRARPSAPARRSRWSAPAPPRRRRCSASASGTRPSGSRSAARSTARRSCCTARPAACITRMSVC